jgi:tetratricopeptide (TPR) repeat protein
MEGEMVELDDFEDGHAMTFKTNKETAQKIKNLKGKKEYKDLLALADSMPNTREKYMLQANALLHLKRWRELSETCDKGLDLSKEEDSADFLNLKGKAVGKLGNFEEKVQLTAKAIEIDPKVAAYHRNLGAAYYKLKDYERAAECHSRAIDLEPKHSINYHNKGAAFFRLQKYENAVGCFEKATDLDKKQVISFGWLADTYKEMGNFQKAKDYYLRAYELSDVDDYKASAKEMDQKINPDKKKGFFSRIFG